MAIMPIIAVGNAMSTFTAQNIGAKKTERVKSGYLSSIGMITVISAIILIVVLIFKEPIISSFLDSESGKQAIESGIEYISITAYCYVFMGLMHCTNGILRGAGDASFFLLSSLISLGLRVAIVYSLMGVAGSVIIAWAAPISWFASFLFGLARVLSGKWKNKSLVG
jgi:Na+-driven multidrug efflux pump